MANDAFKGIHLPDYAKPWEFEARDNQTEDKQSKKVKAKDNKTEEVDDEIYVGVAALFENSEE